MAFLRTIAGLKSGRVRELKSGALVFGRNPKLCDVVLDHFAVSREHARIEIVDGIAYVEDLDSRNGVLVNGQAIPAGAAGRRRLYHGDRIRIATFEYVYEEDPSSGIALSDQGEDELDVLSTVDVSADSSKYSLRKRDPDKLDTILTIVEELASALELERTLPRILDSLFRSFAQARTGVILLRDEAGSEYRPAALRRRNGDDSPVRISRSLIQHVVQTRSAILTADATSDTRFDPSESLSGLRERSIICCPLIRGDGVIGLIQLDVPSAQGKFGQHDLELLAGLSGHLATAVENSQLHDAALKKQRAELEERFRRLVEGSIQGILVHRRFQPLFVNEAYARLHGYTVAEILEMPTILPLIGPDEHERMLGFAEAGGREGTGLPARYETSGYRRDGSTIWLEKFVSIVDWVDGPAFQTAVIDVSDRKRAEEALRAANDELETCVARRTGELAQTNQMLEAEIADRKHKEEELRDSEALYHSLVDHIPLCVARKDLQGAFTFVNRALAEFLGKRPEEILGKTDYELFPRDAADNYRRDDQTVASSGQPLELSEQLALPDGRVLHVHTLKTPIRGADSRIVGTQLVLWDVTRETQTQAELDRYAKELERSNRDLEQFANSVSHDLQSPLRTIASYCQLIEKHAAAKLDAEETEFLDYAVDGVRRMKRLLDDLLTYSRVSTKAKELQPVDANRVLREAIGNLQASIQEHQATIEFDPLPTVVADATQLMQVFQNLLGNAIRYRRDEPPAIHVAAHEEAEAWKFAVRDNGVGIEARHFERIFQIFQRLYAEHEIPGSGVGLAICKRIVERHGGQIWVESVPGQGSTFFFTLPKRT